MNSAGAASWAKTHKPELALGLAGIAVAVYLYEKNSNSASSTTTDTSSLDTGSPYDIQVPPAESAPTSTKWTIPVGIMQKGSGFVVPGQAGLIETDTGGTEYEEIMTGAELKSATAADQVIYYQPTPGTFVTVKGKKGIQKATPYFTRIG